MKKVFNVISKLAKVNTPFLLEESGTGKELVAKAIIIMVLVKMKSLSRLI